jgi:RNA polymerase sigma-70 factor, ECF subfamily
MMPFVPWTRRRAETDSDSATALARLAGGDSQALESLYRRESGPVYRYALALCGNPAWAADATQDAFIALVQRPQGYDAAQGAIGAYLAGIARNALRTRWREADGHSDVDDEPPAWHGSAASPEALLVRVQDGQALWQALRALPAAFREAVVLVDLQERAYAEAAQIAGIEINTLRTRLHRGRTRLAALLAGESN